MGATSELGEKVVLLYDGGNGAVVRFAEALVPGSSSLNRVVCGLPWEDATVIERATGELVHFKDDADVSQVSIIVLKCEVLASACAQVAHDIFEFLSTSAPIHTPNFTFIIPAISRIPGSVMKDDTDNNSVAIYTAFLNSAAENSKGTTGYLPKLPPTFPIRDPFLAYLFHFVHATGLPTLLLVAPSNHGSVGEKGDGIKVLHMLGDVVAKQAGLTYLKQKLNEATDLPSAMAGVEDDWRRLYI